MKRNAEIDRLRALAIIMIVYAHFCRIFYPWAISLNEMYVTSMADLFFVISGFVISSIIIDRMNAIKGNSFELATFIKSFYIRRIYRIYPAAWCVFAGVMLLSIFFSDSGIFSDVMTTLKAGVYLFTYTFNYYFITDYHSLALSPYWTLSIEEQFYFLFPLFIIMTKNNRQRVCLLSGVLFAITFIIRPLTMSHYPFEGLFFSQTRCDGFIYGYFIYCLTKKDWISAYTPSDRGVKLVRCLFVCILIAILIAITAMDISANLVIPLSAIISSILVLSASFEKQMIVFPFGLQRLLDVTGARSYSLYLVHMPIILFANVMSEKVSMNGWRFPFSNSSMAFILIVLATEIIYRCIEKPSQLLGKKIAKNINDKFNQDNLLNCLEKA